MTLQVSMTSLVFLVGLLAVAVCFDVRSFRIPNALTFGGTLAGLILVVQAEATWQTFALSAGGALTGLLLFLPFYAAGKVGGGDVKLLAMVGVFVGPLGVFWAMVWSLIAGGVLAIAWLLGVWGFRELAYRTLGTVTMSRLPGGGSLTTGDTESDDSASPMKTKMPYAPALAVGAIIVARAQLA